MPYNRSTWIKQKVQETFAGRKPSKTNLWLLPCSRFMNPELTREVHRKLLFAISSMFAFYNTRRNVSDKVKLQERLSRIPATLLDGLFSKFTDSARGSTKSVISSVTNAYSHQRVTLQNACYTGTGDKLVDTYVRSMPPGGRMGDRYGDPGWGSQFACCKNKPAVQNTWFVCLPVVHVVQK